MPPEVALRRSILLFAALVAVSFPVFAEEQEETFIDLVPGKDMLDPATLVQLVRQGDVHAINNIGLLWAKGYQGKQSYEEAVRWWKEAARRGYPVSMNNVGLAYSLGQGVEKDAKQAFEWWHQSAFLGNAWAMNSVGDCYEKGDGVEQNDMMAMTWYQSAAQLGDAMAMFNIGMLHERGRGVDRDFREAMNWYRKSAQKGDASAMRALGRLYRYGLGVSTDAVEAWAWHTVAAARFPAVEVTEANANRRELEELQATMTAEQLSQAQSRAERVDLLTRPPAAAAPSSPQYREKSI